MTNPLSPAAQVVVDAWVDQVYDQSGTNAQGLAAALRAVADQVVPLEPEDEELEVSIPDDFAEWAQYSQRQHTRSQLLAIAAELEAQP